jgi:protein-disulfide isomerase
LTLLCILGIVSSSRAQSTSKTLAVVNGESITEQDVARVADGRLRQLAESREDSQSDAAFERAKLAIRWDVLNYLIERKLIRAEASRRMISEDDLVDSEIENATPEPTREAAEAFLTANTVRMPLIKRLSHAEAISQIRGYLSVQYANAIRATYVDKLSKQYGVETFLEPLRLEISTAGFPSRGAAAAAVTIVEFADFACPDCAVLDQSLQQLQKTNAEKLRVVYRQFPLAHLNAHAQKAAEASLCANDQQQFWEFHDAMFGNQTDLKDDDLKQRAANLKLDTTAFNDCLDSGRHVADIDKEIDEGYSVGVTMAPTIFINGRRFFGNRSLLDIQQIIDEELKRGSRQ